MTLSRGNAGCELDRATADIHNLAFAGPDTRINRLDLTMDVHCRANYGQTVRGRLRFHDRADLTAPPRVTNVRASRDGGYVTLSWTNPTSSDFSRTIVRWYTGRIAPGAPDAGNVASFGTASTVRFSAPSTKSIAISIWTYDTTGNASSRYGIIVDP